ncbi:orotidine 5'-phosphate decarboxylase [Cytobacillus sp. S13-E01]|uniref:3-hexulose-6-phosphate synthase n=1 Tax=Cytobacillus sp. S13-E01 TaxID=3031326 RepID=UPI0023D8018C|nr:3-hexulose-6-phosphate synthase [Cytobacillus sp. S13-E01]MDF0726337.1 orotidine 5'-phosphate decarboxylase [Cytobacillus sp. S13-E01]
MNIQLALDRLNKEQCFRILKETKESVDWIEVGTGVIKEYGMSIIRDIKEAYPDKIIVADMKTCDAGKHEAIQAFEAGADITTVMSFSADKTITDSLDVARTYRKKIMIDLLGVTQQQRMVELSDFGVDLVSLHFGKDMQLEGELHTDLFSLVQDFSEFEVAVAGGIDLHSLPEILKKKPETIIVGSAITKATDCSEVALKMKGMINEYEVNH